MTLLGRVLGRGSLRSTRLWFWINRLSTLNMAAEAEAHRGKHFLSEGVILPRAETGEQRSRDHFGWHRFFDGGLDRPSAFARILDEA